MEASSFLLSGGRGSIVLLSCQLRDTLELVMTLRIITNQFLGTDVLHVFVLDRTPSIDMQEKGPASILHPRIGARTDSSSMAGTRHHCRCRCLPTQTLLASSPFPPDGVSLPLRPSNQFPPPTPSASEARWVHESWTVSPLLSLSLSLSTRPSGY